MDADFGVKAIVPVILYQPLAAWIYLALAGLLFRPCGRSGGTERLLPVDLPDRDGNVRHVASIVYPLLGTISLDFAFLLGFLLYYSQYSIPSFKMMGAHDRLRTGCHGKLAANFGQLSKWRLPSASPPTQSRSVAISPFTHLFLP